MRPHRLLVLVWVVGWLMITLAGPQAATAQEVPADSATQESFRPYLSGGFSALGHSGIWMAEVPARPVGGDYVWGGGDNYYGVGFGVNVDYHATRHLTAHFDITHYRLTTPVAYEGGYAHGWWVESVSNFNQETIGPFQENVNYWRNSTGVRVGLKGYFLRSGQINAWAGSYLGYYTWTIENISEDRTHSYGSTSGTAMAPSLINVGVDFWNPGRTLGATVYFETGSGLTGAYTIENCLAQGWTYESGMGEPLMGPVRLGVSFNFTKTGKDSKK